MNNLSLPALNQAIGVGNLKKSKDSQKFLRKTEFSLMKPHFLLRVLPRKYSKLHKGQGRTIYIIQQIVYFEWKNLIKWETNSSKVATPVMKMLKRIFE